MILHFKDVSGGDYLNVNFAKEIYNDVKCNPYFFVTVSPDDMCRIKQEMDFNCYSYSLDDPTLTHNADDDKGGESF